MVVVCADCELEKPYYMYTAVNNLTPEKLHIISFIQLKVLEIF